MIVPFLPGLAKPAARLHEACFPQDPWPAEAFTALLASKAYGYGWVADKTLKGLILARDAADESEILTLAVDPESRRRGIGTGLLLSVCAACRTRGLASLFLEVADDNQAALQVYRAAGFAQVGERSAYYRTAAGPVDALIMVKTFGPAN